jgi:sensor histidine kinase YesM
MKIDWIDKLRYFLQTLAFCLAISAIEFAFKPDQSYAVMLTYSVCIGISCWALIDFGRHLFASAAETGWPQGFAGLALPLAGNAAGFLIGTLAADSWFGWSTFDSRSMPQLKLGAITSTVAGIIICYYFYSLSKSAQLEREMSEARRQASEAKLKLLETRLEPHMLFNTLAYLRATLSASRAGTHPLSAEFERLRDYLELMAVRMGQRLSYELDLPPELAHHPVPPLLLQPLVENSIKHGLEPQVAGGQIRVQARRDGDQLVLEVIDTGVGCDPLSVSQAPGFGISQVRERLITAYGAAGALNLIAAHASGTGAEIRFPLNS